MDEILKYSKPVLWKLKEKGLASVTTRYTFGAARSAKVWYAIALKGCLHDNKLIIGFRKVQSVDFFNRLKTSVPLTGLGFVEVEVNALTFTYNVDPTVDSELVKVGPHKGKIQVFVDPTDGEWKLLESSLPY